MQTFNISCPLMLYHNMLAIIWFSSKIHLRYFRKRSHHFHQLSVGVDSSSQQKPVRSFHLRDPSKFVSTTSYNSYFPFYSLRSNWVFSQPKRKNRMVQYSGYAMAAACVSIGKHPISLGSPLPCEPLHSPYESRSRVCEFFGIWLHFLSEWTKHFFIKEWWI
jgi:hypothetical protein